MELKQPKRSIYYYLRTLHRDIGFFLVGLTMIYCISGILLIYRGTGFLQYKETIQKKISVGLNTNELEKTLGLRHFKIEKQDDKTVYFNGGSYDRSTGVATYTKSEFPAVLNMFKNVHTITSRNTMHLFATVYAILLLFLAISSFWMYKPGTKLFRRGISFSTAGVILAAVLMFTSAG